MDTPSTENRTLDSTHRFHSALKRKIPLRYTIAFVFTLLSFLSGVTLITFNYLHNERTALITTNDLLERISRQVATQVSELLAPVQATVNISSKTIRTVGRTFDDRLELLEYFVEILRQNRRLSSMYVADVDGDFFIVRSVENNADAGDSFDAPPDTSFIVQGIDRERDELLAEQVMFLDAKLFLIDSRTVAATAYDHRKQPWFKAAIYNHELVTSNYYVFFATREIGLTVARRLKEGNGVVAADLTLRDMSGRLASQNITPSTELVLVDDGGTIVAHSDYTRIERLFNRAGETAFRMPTLNEIEEPAYARLAAVLSRQRHVGPWSIKTDNRDILGYVSSIPIQSGQDLYLASLIPRTELLHDVNRLRNLSILISLGLLGLTIGMVFWLARRISNSLRVLAQEAQSIREFKLDTAISVKTRILEVNDLAATMAVMKSSIQQFLDISRALSEEKNFDHLLEMILDEAQSVAGAQAGAICLRSRDDRRLKVAILHNAVTGVRYGGASGEAAPLAPMDLSRLADRPGKLSAIRHTLQAGEVFQAADISADSQFDFQFTRDIFEHQGFQCRTILIAPLINQKEDIIGILHLINPRHDGPAAPAFRSEIVSYIEALCSDAAVALDNRRLLQTQKDLTDSIIHLLAGAIDAKSPYTSGHCQRVPVIVRMLAESAEASQEEAFREFSLTEDEWYELHLASWLHDCGKITTPEHVVDKATKLETVYNRIHEIRMRFEALWRDAEIDYYRALAEGSANPAALKRQLAKRLAQIQDDFEFVADCNVGGEFMSDAKIARLERIAAQKWLRHLDDRHGLSGEELERKQRTPYQATPVHENLLADKEEHLVYRNDADKIFEDNPYGFKMDVPRFKYNHGEVANLTIPKGTLTPEERFSINNHIIQTIKMLNSLPLPRELKRVPDWAGNHHETYCGHGYPRRLVGRDLSVPERIMAVADVFEALTANDRPYKPARTLNETIQIMSGMCRNGHLCPATFKLLLTTGVCHRYAETYLASAQLDDVDIDAVLAAIDEPTCPDTTISTDPRCEKVLVGQ